jgi:hypothetical protein
VLLRSRARCASTPPTSSQTQSHPWA